MRKIIFYTRLNCHLCDDAYQAILDIVTDTPLAIDIVDVTHPHKKDYMAQYGERIPVIAIPETKAELDWPFTATDIRAYLLGS